MRHIAVQAAVEWLGNRRGKGAKGVRRVGCNGGCERAGARVLSDGGISGAPAAAAPDRSDEEETEKCSLGKSRLRV